MASERHLNLQANNTWNRLINSPTVACIAGSLILWMTFGVRQSFGVFLIPVTTGTGWDRATFSTAVALLQILWGVSQPFLAFLAERKFGFGKTLFVTTLVYVLGCIVMALSGSLPGLFIFATGVLVGGGAGGSGFAIVLASIGRRYPLKSKAQSMAFGLVSSFGSFGQCCFFPIANQLINVVGWRWTLIIFAIMLAATLPLSIFLQTVPAMPPVNSDVALDEKVQPPSDVEMASGDKFGAASTPETSYNLPAPKDIVEDGTIAEVSYTRPEPATIQEALKEAFTSPAFWLVCLGFSVCGFHVAFLGTHLPAYLVEWVSLVVFFSVVQNILLTWTVSIIGFGSMCGTIFVGWLQTRVRPKYILGAIYFLRAVIMVVFVWTPLSLATTFVFAAIMGALWLSTVPATTTLIGSIFGHKYLGTLSSITFVGHQIGAFCGAYLGGVEFDSMHEYNRMWYSSLALAILAVGANLIADDRTRRR